MKQTILILGIIFLLVGVGVVSSTDNIVEDAKNNYHPLESNIESKEILSLEEIAYGYIAYSGSSGHPEGPCYFYLDDPGSITSLKPTESAYFLTGGTWACDDRWFGVEYNTGVLWEINPESGDMVQIGGGGVFCSSLSFNTVDLKLYGFCGTALYAYDITNGEQELICYLDGEPSYLIGIAFNIDGTLYGWDTDNLWIIDIETCECTLVGPHGLDIYFSAYGHFDIERGVLFISTYDSSGKLYECDKDTGECTFIGDFEGGAEITALSIPFICFNIPPSKPIINGPTHGTIGVEYTYTFNSTDYNGDLLGYYVDWGDDSPIEIVYPTCPNPEEPGPGIANHSWDKKGTYIISAYAEDETGLIGPEGELSVTMPRDKTLVSSLFLRFLDHFPLLQLLLDIWRYHLV